MLNLQYLHAPLSHTLSMCILRSVWFQATFKSVLMKNLIPLSNQQLLFKSRSRRFDSFLRICNGDFFEVFTTIGFAYPESKLKKIDLPRERMCFWAVLAEKVAAAAKLGYFTRCLELVFIFVLQI